MLFAHGESVAEGVSDYHLALEVSSACRGLAITVPGETWLEIGGWSVERMSQWLLSLAKRTKLSRYPKAKRGPKKPSNGFGTSMTTSPSITPHLLTPPS